MNSGPKVHWVLKHEIEFWSWVLGGAGGGESEATYIPGGDDFWNYMVAYKITEHVKSI